MEITSVELKEKINKGEKLIIEFWAEWCGPCRMMKPIFERISTENTSDVQMYTMNVDLNRVVGMPVRRSKIAPWRGHSIVQLSGSRTPSASGAPSCEQRSSIARISPSQLKTPIWSPSHSTIRQLPG